MTVIVVTGQEIVTNSDVLQATRLQNAPSNGIIVVECQADLNDQTNSWTVSLQMPDGATPMNASSVPAGTVGQLDDRTKLLFSSAVAAGGHVVLGFTETGTAIVTWRVTFTSM